jgi:peptidoglycan hydrolase-like protein with peptidoglycan-binding domain
MGPLTRALLSSGASAVAEQPSASQESPAFTRNLDVGDTGQDVQALQKYLNAHGFVVAKSGPGASGQETLMFGYATRDALAAYQEANGIRPAIGYFGPLTQTYVRAHP